MINKMFEGLPLKTKFGNAKIDNTGYYRITSGKEGNLGKLLHRLITEGYFGDWINDLDDFFDIHHIDGNPLNNCVLNLEPIPHRDHISLHKSGENHHMFGKNHSDETKRKMSESKNTTGYLNVRKMKSNTCNQGFTWMYQYYDENGTRKAISSVSLDKLEFKVKSRGLKWEKFIKED